jgi:prolipoprotein diacylglyceryl transferase
MGASLLGYIPSPSTSGLSIGSLRIHIYGIMIALAIVAAVWLSQRRWTAIGGAPGTMSAIAMWGVPGGLIGARLYSVITTYNDDTQGHFWKVIAIWDGGLGIWGGIAGGVILGVIGARRMGVPWRAGLDCIAPAFLLAQAIGRWGNYFNQELYGKPSGLPWALRIDHPAAPFPPDTTFQPTFLYESIWDLLALGVILWAERRFRIRRGYLFALYAALYTIGRFWTEFLRIDNAHKIGPLRLNDWVSILVFVTATALLFTRGRWRPGMERAGDPLPVPHADGKDLADAGSPAAEEPEGDGADADDAVHPAPEAAPPTPTSG